MPFELRELRQGDGCNALSLGTPALTPLKSFLRKEAKKLHEENLARTFVLVPSGETKILAYVTTLMSVSGSLMPKKKRGQKNGVRSPWHYLKVHVKKTGGLAVLPDAKLKLFKDSNPLQ